MKSNSKLLSMILVGGLIVGTISDIGGPAQVHAAAASSLASYPSNPKLDSISKDTVEFGHYLQEDTNGDGVFDEKDEKTPIVWRILDTEEDGVSFLVSEKALDFKKLDVDDDTVSWKDTDLRKWLNSEANGFNEEGFLKTAFTEEEQSLIETMHLANSSIDDSDTYDKVFLLSEKELTAANGLDGPLYCKAKATDYVKSLRPILYDGAAYWLRSHGKATSKTKTTSFYGMYVDGKGKSGRYYSRNASSFCVRPAICVRLSSIPNAVYGKTDLAVKGAEFSYITMGTYNGQPIKWRVLHAEKNDALILSENVLQNMEYMHYEYDHTKQEATWEKSDIRKWLNGNGKPNYSKPYLYKDAFTEDERSAIMLSDVKVVNNPTQGNPEPGKDTKDYLFLLTVADVLNTSYGFSVDYNLFPETRIAKDASGTALSWWTRTTCLDSYDLTVIADTGIMLLGNPGIFPTNYSEYKSEYGVRPAMHVDLSNPIFGLNFAQKIELNKKSDELLIGEDLQLSATITPSDAIFTDVIWKSDNTDVATVDENGKVTALAKGQAKITATIDDGTGKTAECTIKVKTTKYSGQDFPKNPEITYLTRDTVEFGSYIQRDVNGDKEYTEADREPITWQVISTDESTGESLLVSDKVLDAKPYNNARIGRNKTLAWKDTALRKWLNSIEDTAVKSTEKGFLNDAFSADEQNKIISTEVDTDVNDKVFLLTEEDVCKEEYGFTGVATSCDEARATQPTDYAYNFDEENCSEGEYWLMAREGSKAVRVETSGKVSDQGLINRSKGVRPAIRINLSSIPEAKRGTVNVAIKDVSYSTLVLGNTAKLITEDALKDAGIHGTYEAEPITWRVLSVKGNDALLIADKAIAHKNYHEDKEASGITWETSSIRKWLNGEAEGSFYADAFDDNERSAIKESKIENKTSPFDEDIKDLGLTRDKLFLPSAYDVMNPAYGFSSNPDVSSNTRLRRDIFGSDTPWWLRTPGSEDMTALIIYTTTYDSPGSVDTHGNEISKYDYKYGVCPAMHIDLANPIFDFDSSLLEPEQKEAPEQKPEPEKKEEPQPEVIPEPQPEPEKKEEPQPEVIPEPQPEPEKKEEPQPEVTPEPTTPPEMTLNTESLTLQVKHSSSAVKATLVNDEIKSVTSSNDKEVSASFAGDTITLTAGDKAGDAIVEVTSASGITRTVDVEVQKEAVTTKSINLSSSSVTLAGKDDLAKVWVNALPDETSTGEAISVSASNSSKKVIDVKYDAATRCIDIVSKKKGNATIKIKAGHISKTLKVTVKDHLIYVATTNVTMQANSTDKVGLTFANDSLKSLTSNDKAKKKIASLSYEDGAINIVAGEKSGKATITVKSQSGLTKRITVNIQKDPVTTKTLSLEKKSVSLAKKGITKTVKVKASPDKISTGENVNISMTEEDAKVANAYYNEANGTVVITAKKKGKASVNVTVGTKTKTIIVTVKK